MTFYMLIGIAGCGKTTWVMKHTGGAIVVSPDNIRETLFGSISDQSQNDIVWKTAQYMITYFLRESKDVILDATNVNTRLRRQLLEKLPECRREAVVFDIEPESACKRINADILNRLNRAKVPDEVVYRMYGEFLYMKKVIADEGFDEIIWVKM